MTNPNTKAASNAKNEETGRILNHRFGYEWALTLTLGKHGFSGAQVAHMIGLAHDRKLEEFAEYFERNEP